MSDISELQKVSQETMRFMRGKYALDEVPGKYYAIDCLKFRQGKKTILSINIHEDHYDFQIIFGKAERDKFEARRDTFPNAIQDMYDRSHTLPDGKWMLIRVDNMAALENVKQLILIKKNPNRKPFPKAQAVYADCGHRCDLCVHYTGGTISDAFREELKERLARVYCASDSTDASIGAGRHADGSVASDAATAGVVKGAAEGTASDDPWGKDVKRCRGCHNGGYDGHRGCEQKSCAAGEGADKCVNCSAYPCHKSTAGWPPRIETKHIRADDVTWAILPYVENQYGN